jgi:hypothetical protein
VSELTDDLAVDAALYEQFAARLAARQAHQDFRSNTWRTKDGRSIPLKDMDDAHLCNAYKHSGRTDLFKEMVVRLFETRIKEGT